MASKPPTRTKSYYDADQDIYHLSSLVKNSESKSAHMGAKSAQSLNNSLREKDSILKKLDAEVISMNAQLREAEARIRYHEDSRTRALEEMACRHRNQVEKLKATAHKAAHTLKARLTRCEKTRKDAQTESLRYQQEINELQDTLSQITRDKGRCMGEIESLTARVAALTKKLDNARDLRQEERSHSQKVEINLHEIGSRLENVIRENRRLQELRRNDDSSRDSIIEGHGKQMRALTDQLEARTRQLRECEQKKDDAIASRDKALSSLDEFRMGAGQKLEGRDSVLSRQRKEIEQLKDNIAEYKREIVVQSGRIESLERDVKDLRDTLHEKNKQIDSLQGQVESEREMEHNISATNAEVRGRLTSIEKTAEEQAEVIKQLNDELTQERKLVAAHAQKVATLEAELARSKNNVVHRSSREEVAVQHAKDLENQVQTLEAALEASRKSKEGQPEEWKRLHSELDRKDNIIAEKEKALAVYQQQVKDLEAELARRTLRAAGMAAEKIQSEKAKLEETAMYEKRRLEETAMYEKRRLEEEIREKERQLQEKGHRLEEERRELEMRERLAAERRKWEEDQKQHIREEEEEEDRKGQERLMLIKKMKQMEQEMDKQMASKRLAEATKRSNSLHSGESKILVHRPSGPSGSSSHRRGSAHHHAMTTELPPKKLPDAEKMLGFDHRAGGEQMDERSEQALRELVNRADALREEADIRKVGSPELIERVGNLTLELAERIAIECYDVGEHLYEIMDDAHPVLMQATMRQRAPRARARDVADAKNTIAAAMSVARSRVRAALHISRDGVLYWLLSLYGNVAALLQGLRQPDTELIPYDDKSTSPSLKQKRELRPVAGRFSSLSRKKQVRGKRSRKGSKKIGKHVEHDLGQCNPNSIVASRDLVRVCSNQWTERRWPSQESGVLSEVRAAVEKAAEDEYWRRYAEAMSDDPERHHTAERDSNRIEVDEPNANLVFWQLLVSLGLACKTILYLLSAFSFNDLLVTLC